MFRCRIVAPSDHGQHQQTNSVFELISTGVPFIVPHRPYNGTHSKEQISRNSEPCRKEWGCANQGSEIQIMKTRWFSVLLSRDCGEWVFLRECIPRIRSREGTQWLAKRGSPNSESLSSSDESSTTTSDSRLVRESWKSAWQEIDVEA